MASVGPTSGALDPSTVVEDRPESATVGTPGAAYLFPEIVIWKREEIPGFRRRLARVRNDGAIDFMKVWIYRREEGTARFEIFTARYSSSGRCLAGRDQLRALCLVGGIPDPTADDLAWLRGVA